jgi:hypothetical protein
MHKIMCENNAENEDIILTYSICRKQVEGVLYMRVSCHSRLDAGDRLTKHLVWPVNFQRGKPVVL